MAAGGPHGAKLLSAGRVVILRDGVSKRRFLKTFLSSRAGMAHRLFFHSLAFNLMLGCCSNLRKRKLPLRFKRTGLAMWIPIRSPGKR